MAKFKKDGKVLAYCSGAPYKNQPATVIAIVEEINYSYLVEFADGTRELQTEYRLTPVKARTKNKTKKVAKKKAKKR